MQPIIIFGTGRSGTTVLSEILFRHRRIGYPSNYSHKYPQLVKLNLMRYLFDNKFYRVFGQTEQLEKQALYKKFVFQPSEAYGLWNFLTKEDINFSKNFLYGHTPNERTKTKVHTYFNRLLHYQGRDKLGFKFTGPGRIGYVHDLFPDARLIRVTRDFIPTLSSFMKVGFWRNGQGSNKLWWHGGYTHHELSKLDALRNDPILFTAFQLWKVIRITELEIEKYKPSLLEIRYEDFVLNPKETIEKILDWTNLDFDDSCFDYLNNTKIVARQKVDTDYFQQRTLDDIATILRDREKL